MGGFYVNSTLRGPSQEEVASCLREEKRVAYVSPTFKRFTTVFDAECDTQDEKAIADSSTVLSGRFKCPVLSVLNHDDDILMYWLYSDGLLIDRYNSYPGYFGGPAGPIPEGGDAAKICKVIGQPEAVERVEQILRTSSEEDEFCFAVDRHRVLAEALGLPDLSIGFGYRALDCEDDEALPQGVERSQFAKIP